VSTEQRETLDAILRRSALPAGSDVDEQRRQLQELISAQPPPADVTVTAGALGGVPTAEITVDGIEPRHIVLPSTRTRRRLTTLWRPTKRSCATASPRRTSPSPESPPAAASPSPPWSTPRDHALPLPAAALVMSPYVDLTLAGTTIETRREFDPLLSFEALRARVTDYTAGQDAALGLISPIFADLSGLPPLIIQAGTHEVLLDDAVRLARQAATADVEVTLDITPRGPHVFQAYYPILDEVAGALDRAGQFLSAQLAGAERVTVQQKAERMLSL
jgi:epsilon-lactone hydrolase